VTEEEFWAALSEIAEIPGGEFAEDGEGLIRRYSDGMCPICAVCFARTGRRYDNQAYDLAAIDLGLPQNVTCRVANAADNYLFLDSIRETRQRLQTLVKRRCEGGWFTE
jgi:hypothetical protein